MALKERPYEALGLGAACIDLIIPVSDDFLATVPGKKGGAQIIDFEGLTNILEKSDAKPKVVTGGSCANTIKGLAKLGLKCALLSKIGSDSLGVHFTESMRKMGVIPLFLTAHSPTPRVLCMITPDGQRTMRFFSGCCEEMSEKYLHSDYVKDVKLVHMDAYSFRSGLSVERMADLAQDAQALTSIDLSSFEIVQEFQERIQSSLKKNIDIVFANEDETKALTGLPPYEGCRTLQEMCSIAVVLTGKDGCLVGHGGKIFHSPAFPARVVDTTGAGDLFASGFLYGHLKGASLETCARFGNLLGSAVIGVTGAEIPDAQWETIRQTLKNPTF